MSQEGPRIWCKQQTHKKKRCKRKTVIGHLAIWSHHESDKSSHYVFFSLFFRKLSGICIRSDTQPLMRCQSKEFRVGILWFMSITDWNCWTLCTAHHFSFLELRMMVQTLIDTFFFNHLSPPPAPSSSKTTMTTTSYFIMSITHFSCSTWCDKQYR